MNGRRIGTMEISAHAGGQFSEIHHWGESFGRRGISAAEAALIELKGLQVERRTESRRIEAIRAGAQTDPVEITMLQLEDDPDFASFNIVEDW